METAYRHWWLVEGRVVVCEMTGTLETDNTPGYDQEMNQFLDAGTAPLVHYVVDALQISKPSGLQVLRTLTFPRHPRFGWALIITNSNPLMSMIVRIVTTFFNIRAREFKTVDAALDFLQYVDETLPDLREAYARPISAAN